MTASYAMTGGSLVAPLSHKTFMLPTEQILPRLP
jgi:hypothetical protein